MHVKELFYGLHLKNSSKISTFENKYGYKKMLIEENISLDFSCEHNFSPIKGYAHVASITHEKVIGLSKINRLVALYAHRPQVQQRLSLQILKELQNTLETEDVIVMICAKNLYKSSRGIKDKNSVTTTMESGGGFIKTRNEFL